MNSSGLATLGGHFAALSQRLKQQVQDNAPNSNQTGMLQQATMSGLSSAGGSMSSQNNSGTSMSSWNTTMGMAGRGSGFGNSFSGTIVGATAVPKGLGGMSMMGGYTMANGMASGTVPSMNDCSMGSGISGSSIGCGSKPNLNGSLGCGGMSSMGCGMGASMGGSATSSLGSNMSLGMSSTGANMSLGLGANLGSGIGMGMGAYSGKSSGKGFTMQAYSQNQSLPQAYGQAADQANGSSLGVRFPLAMQRPSMQLRGVTTPAARFQLQQAQHEQRLMQQTGTGNQWPGQTYPVQAMAGQVRGMRPQVIRPPGAAGASTSSASSAPGAAAKANFPPALQQWIQRLFVQPEYLAGDKRSQLQDYLRNWVQHWVKTGEIWHKKWEAVPMPTPDEIRLKLPPGSLGKAPDINQGSSSASIAQAAIAAYHAQRPKAPPMAPNFKQGYFAKPAFDRRQSRSLASRSRSKSGRRRSRSPMRRRRARPSSSSSFSRSRSGRRRLSLSPRSDRSSSDDRQASTRNRGKGKGKDKGKAADGKGPAFEELRDKVKTFLNARLDVDNSRLRHKELQDELQLEFGVTPKRFRSLFQQTLAQYCNAYARGGAEAVEDVFAKSKHLAPGEQDLRALRAARFQSHLASDRVLVSMVSFNDSENAGFDGGPIVGELNDMCSREEAKEREMTRQLDKFEWKRGTDPKNAEVNLAFATKKYQRSSADKAYRSQDVRSLPACWRTMEYLMTEILDFDSNPKAGYAVQSVPYIEVYSYLRDRTRSIRVDLHLQQPKSTTQKVFVETHECCLRFEMLSLFLLLGRGGAATERYDAKLGLKAISQTIEPLLNAYKAIRDKLLAKSILAEAGLGDFCLDDGEAEQDYVSPWEMSSHRYIILLLMSFSPEALMSHLSKLSRETLLHPLVSFATQVYAAFMTDDYAMFLRAYRDADFLSAVAMSGLADLARLRALWLLVRTYPQPIGDKVSLARLKNILAFTSDDHAKSFLAFHGLQIVIDASSDGGAHVILPKKGTPEAAKLPLLQGPAKLPDKCEFPKGADSLLVSKFNSLPVSRADLVFGAADPIVEVPPDEEPTLVGTAPDEEQQMLDNIAAAEDEPMLDNPNPEEEQSGAQAEEQADEAATVEPAAEPTEQRLAPEATTAASADDGECEAAAAVQPTEGT